MTFTVDSITLNVTGFSESAKPVGSEWLAWEGERVARKRFTYGMLREWTLSCFEVNVAWSSSAAKYLQDKMKDGEKVSFSVSEGGMHQISSVQCYVRDLEINYGRGSKSTQFKREFTVTFQEASSP